MTCDLVIEALRTDAVSKRFYQELRFEAAAVDAAIVRLRNCGPTEIQQVGTEDAGQSRRRAISRPRSFGGT